MKNRNTELAKKLKDNLKRRKLQESKNDEIDTKDAMEKKNEKPNRVTENN